ncbi:FecR family protein [Echinicola sediminis]
MDKKKQLDDFIEGRLSDREAQAFLEWIMSQEGEEELAASIDEVWFNKNKEEEYPEWDMEKLLSETQRLRGEGKKLALLKSGKVNNGPSKNRSWNAPWLRVAAVLVFLFSFSYVLLKWNEKPVEVKEIPAPEFITRSNPSGVKTKVQLPDGSVVLLNSESSLTYAKDFVNNRNVELEGEAFFMVNKDSLHPFSVKSKRLTTVALGTSFNIKAFKGDEKVEVTLATGKVRVEDELTSKALLLDPGEATKVEDNSESFDKYKADVSFITQWRFGVLEFRKTPFIQIIEELERWYGVQIKVNGELPAEKGSGKFRDGESLVNVLDVLSYSVDFDYEIKKNLVEITFK